MTLPNSDQSGFALAIDWFYENWIVLNACKYHFECLGKHKGNAFHNFNGKTHTNCEGETILGI